MDKIIPLPTTTTFIEVDPDLLLFNKMSTGNFDFWRNVVINPELGGTIFAVVDSGFIS